jgi:hypothetical protein
MDLAAGAGLLEHDQVARIRCCTRGRGAEGCIVRRNLAKMTTHFFGDAG